MTRTVKVVVLIIVAGVAALIVAGLSRPAPIAASAPVVGHPAPDFMLSAASNGRTISLSDYRGRPVLVNFFATWCVPCTREMPQIERRYRDHSNQLAVLGVDRQEPAADVNAMRRRLGIKYPLLLDDRLTVWQLYRVAPQPVSFWIDQHGVIRAIHYGPMSDSYMRRELTRLLA